MPERLVIPRRRLVNFRLTEDEFQRLRTASIAQGCRGLSDFARTTLLASLHQLSSVDVGGDVLVRLNERLTELSGTLDALLKSIHVREYNS